ncbi:MAG: cytochrome P450 [Bryobacterales bacterium]|nr:cytochrome P450 [Bryobacterales bacterium]MDE0296841.1 cytochrome P450 [Bryobacterales bacterium]MDE0433155.1 cytochrome P450 [Bryobacterales bacterium]
MSAPTQIPIRLAEELILLMLNERSGYLEMVPGWAFSCVMAGAVIADLTLEDRIDTDLKTLYLVDPTPTGDDLLDPTLKEIAESQETADTQYWIERNTGRSDEIVMATLDRLVERKILDYESGGFWGLSRSVSRSGTYQTHDLQIRQEAKARVLSVILNDVIPDPRDAILIALMHTCGGFKLLLEPEDYEEKLERIETIAKLDLVGRTVASAVKDSTAKPKTRRVLQTKPIPKLRIFDALRQRDFRTGNIPKAMYGIFQKYGPVVELPFKMRKATLVALMGPDTNQWVNKHGRFYLRSKDYIQDLERVFGASRTLPGLDGADHYKMRKSLQGAYSRAALTRRLPELVHLCRRSLSRWSEGDVFGAADAFQNHVSSQISHLMIGVDCSHYVDELLEYEHRALVTQVQGALPKFMLSTPKMKRYGKRVRELHEAITASHTPAQRRGKPPDIADAILELHKNDPQFLPETDITFPFVAAMVASIYLGSGLAFAVYNMVRHPDLYARIHREAELLFGNGREPEAKDFTLDSVDVTHRLCMESARVYPVIPWQLRTVMNECIVSGFQIPPKTHLLICQTATHYADDLFKDPLEFDIDRYLPDRAEHTKPGAYAPYGLGTHTCLGNRWVELQMAVNLLLIAYHLKLEVAPANYKIGINPFPTSAPNKKMKFRVAEITNPT